MFSLLIHESLGWGLIFVNKCFDHAWFIHDHNMIKSVPPSEISCTCSYAPVPDLAALRMWTHEWAKVIETVSFSTTTCTNHVDNYCTTWTLVCVQGIPNGASYWWYVNPYMEEIVSLKSPLGRKQTQYVIVWSRCFISGHLHALHEVYSYTVAPRVYNKERRESILLVAQPYEK